MTDENPNAGGTTPGTGTGTGAGDESEWQEHAAQGEGREWLSQLQNMIEQIATQAAPVVREVGAKAAELAAAAGEKAGPVAHRAAELTSEAGLKLAERSRTFAAEIRRDQAARGENGSATGASDAEAATEGSEEPTSTGVG
jgi:hypothetical protein